MPHSSLKDTISASLSFSHNTSDQSFCKTLQLSNNANILTTGKTLEETYQKKTQLGHILLRPNTSIRSIEKHTYSLQVFEKNCMVYSPILYVRGLYKIFDQILVNAANNKQRDPKMEQSFLDRTHWRGFFSVPSTRVWVDLNLGKTAKGWVANMEWRNLFLEAVHQAQQSFPRVEIIVQQVIQRTIELESIWTKRSQLH